MTDKLLAELSWRGMLYQTTDGVSDALSAGTVTGYAGFDPTAASLHVGNLVPVMGLVHLQQSGHRPIALVGGGTGMVGDPSGKTSERQLAATETVDANARSIGTQLAKFLAFTGPRAAQMRNNADWLRPLNAVDFLRDVGKHFTVNYMLAKDSVQSRIEGGISFTEFSYMLLQAYDFLELSRRDGVTLQIGGSDQWGNITAGLELIRRMDGKTAHGITFPLFTTAGGGKFGKTESGTVWLDPELTSPYKFYQFWINTDDRDASRSLRLFTLLPHERIEELERALSSAPDKREAQQALAAEVTARVHGEDTARIAVDVSGILFGKGDPASLSEKVLRALSREVPFVEASVTPTILDALVLLKLAASKGAGRRLLQQGGIYLNGKRIADNEDLTSTAMLPGGHYLLRKGARDYGLIRVRV